MLLVAVVCNFYTSINKHISFIQTFAANGYDSLVEYLACFQFFIPV